MGGAHDERMRSRAGPSRLRSRKFCCTTRIYIRGFLTEWQLQNQYKGYVRTAKNRSHVAFIQGFERLEWISSRTYMRRNFYSRANALYADSRKRV
ncbi:hypothetical protein Y032_0611g643 [Ancylostoma ceylanicum]|uniref:Uncharacterized protein n=1 Tax=Ancylostoma ceylanicum TaxID=53326 RepID=A0A016WN69_9BILA|nr:hypothetical protein Y032_0611g643 [Ancylostoma ceylanicum]